MKGRTRLLPMKGVQDDERSSGNKIEIPIDTIPQSSFERQKRRGVSSLFRI